MAGISQKSLFSWIEGIPYEVAFWNNFYRFRKKRADLFKWSGYGGLFRLDRLDVETLFKDRRESPVVIDLGSSLSYLLGNKLDNGDLKSVEIIHVDPLACFYNRILDKYKIDRPRIQAGFGEGLSAYFKPGSVDIVHISNALDHSAYPLTVIFQSLIVLKPRGILYLNHHVNEAEREAYRGFHQHNVAQDGDDTILWNPKERISLKESLNGFATLRTEIGEFGNVVTIIEKKADIPGNVASVESAVEFVTAMMATNISYFHKSRNNLRYQYLKMKANTAHFITKLLPYNLTKSLKRFLNR